MAVVVAAASVSCRRGTLRSQCEDALNQEQYGVAMAACAASYKQSAAPLDQWLQAKAVFLGDGCAGARPLLETIKDEAYLGDAELRLAHCDLEDGDTKSERTRLGHAIALFEKTGNYEGHINALLSLANSHLVTGDLDLANTESSRAFEMALAAGESLSLRVTHRAFITVIDVASRIQDYERVVAVIEESRHRTWSEASKGWLAHREATYYQETGEPSVAKKILDDVTTTDPRLDSQRANLLPWLDYLTDDYDNALSRLDARREDQKGEEPFDSLLLRALIAAAKKDWKVAQGFLDAAEKLGPPDEDFRWDLERAKAELAEQMGEVSVAVESYRKTICFISAARLAAPTVAPFFVASHRAPYEGLIALLAERNEWREALKVVLLLDSANLLLGTGTGAGGKIAFGEKAPSVTPACSDPLAIAEELVDEVIQRWAARGTLSIVVTPEPRKVGPVATRARPAYRIVIRDGAVSGQVLKEKSDVLLKLYESADTEAEVISAGKTFAKIFIPDEEETPVTILAIGRLSKVPLTWLQDEAGRLIVGKRSVSRTFGLREETETPAYSKEAVVLAADPGSVNKLPFLEKDAAMAVQRLQAYYPAESIQRFGIGTSTLATRERLLEAKRAEVLYLAAHVDVRERRRVVLLDTSDGKSTDEVPARDLNGAGLAPKLAVLANCGSGAAQDEAGWGSVAAALIGAGSSAVVATLESVDDAQAHALMSAFMSQPDWQSDPARALGRVQQMAKDGPINGVVVTATVWRAFMVITRAPYVPAPQTASLQQP